MEAVALESSGSKRKTLSMEDKADTLQRKGMEMQQKADDAIPRVLASVQTPWRGTRNAERNK